MSATWGKNFKITIFGESHGECIGIVIDGIPSGVELNDEMIFFEMSRRSSKGGSMSTGRREPDRTEIVTGLFNGKTTGAPMTVIIKNTDKISRDYDMMKSIARPGHADFTAFVKYSGFNDYRGGGHFSGRLTAPIVFAGAIAKQLLMERGIFIGSHINSIGKIEDRRFNTEDMCKTSFDKLTKSDFPILRESLREDMISEIENTRSTGDSLGGVIECSVIGLSAGVGNPFFESIESVLSSILFSIPSIKGVEFGAGFDISKMLGSEANDEIFIEDEAVKTKTNYNGGINGGISNGMPIVFRVAVKPTPSISKAQSTIDFLKKENVELSINGRHDAVIVPRVLPVVEAVTAIAILDMIL